MSGPQPAVAAVRLAVREAVAALPPGALVLVACSGGTDSLALAAGLAFEAPRLGQRAGALVVDHGLQCGSGEVARGGAGACRRLGLAPVQVLRVAVPAGRAGPEAAARAARYGALDAAAARLGADAVLLGHTLDDQAEQVLLGLLRGSGARSLSGMPRARGRYLRPLLGLSREQTWDACAAAGLQPWLDPHNADPAYARVRVRTLLATLEHELGPGIAAALARTADQLREDADHLDALAETAVAALGPGPWPASRLHGIPRAVRTRVWRRLLLAAGAPAGSVSDRHVQACDRLLTHWHGQGGVHAPGGVLVQRRVARVSIGTRTPVE